MYNTEFPELTLESLEIPALAAAGAGAAAIGNVLAGASLGLAVFQAGQAFLSSGDFSVTASQADYVHPGTPPTARWNSCSVEFKIVASHPRYGFDNQNFWFKLEFEYNGADVRSARINPLREKSSSLHSSSFSITFAPAAYSVPADVVAEVVFNISGRWDPFGSGDYAFRGQLFVRADGKLRLSVQGDEGRVWHDNFYNYACRPLGGLPPVVPPPPGARPTVRRGSRGPAVTEVQGRLNRWLPPYDQLVVDGAFGQKTDAAVRRFQQAQRLQVDGVVGPQTWARLLTI